MPASHGKNRKASFHMADLMPNPGTIAPLKTDAVIRVERVSKVFQTPSRENLDALIDIELSIHAG